MLQVREWSSRGSQTVPRGFYSFILDEQGDRLDMSSIAVLSDDVVLSQSEDADWIFPDQQVTKLLVDAFTQVPEVEAICAQFGPDGIMIWTLLKTYDREAREKVYEKELEICERLRIYDFDFRVTSSDLVSADALVQAGSVRIF